MYLCHYFICYKNPLKSEIAIIYHYLRINTFLINFSPTQSVKVTKIPHEMVHESQILLSLIQAPVIETKDGLKPAWNWGQCSQGSNCPLNAANDKIISKLLIKLQEHDFQQSRNDYRQILKSLQGKEKIIYLEIFQFYLFSQCI